MSARQALPLGDRIGRVPKPPRGRRVLFASAHSIVDFSNGASVATLDLLQRLATLGFEPHAFCTSKLDFHHEVCLEKIVADLREPYHITPSNCGDHRAQVLYTRRHRVPITVIRLESTRIARQRPEEVRAVHGFFDKFLEVNRPDVMITYGGDPISLIMVGLAGEREIPVVFSIHNFAYTDPRPFTTVDHCIVPSEFARRHYRDRVGLDCHVLPYPVDWDRVRVESRDPRFVAFVNPALEKGAAAFVRIARELARRRPDIPILVVESRGDRRTLAACGFDPAACGNVRFMPHTTDPRRFWSVTRFALMPSLWWENQPLVAIEAMINGIPVIGSNRGGIPEAVGGCGLVLPLPERLTPVSTIVPEAEEVEPWVASIVRLWDDRRLYEEQCARARAEAERWNPERLNPLYAEFFGGVRRQPGGPVLARKDPKRAPPREAMPTPLLTVGDRSVRIARSPGSIPLHRVDRTGAAPNATDEANGDDAVALSFVVCSADPAVLHQNLLASPCLGPGSRHQVLTFLKTPNLPAGLNAGLERAKHEWVILIHQDVYLPAGWDRRLVGQLREAERLFGRLGVAGAYGVGEVVQRGGEAPAAVRVGCIVDRGRLLRDGPARPARVATLDEVVLVVRRRASLRLDPSLEFHLYGADLCLQAREQGLSVVSLDVLCHHNSRGIGLTSEFLDDAETFARKWAHRLPIATPCVVFDRRGDVYVLGNAHGDSSLARAEGGPIKRIRLCSPSGSERGELSEPA